MGRLRIPVSGDSCCRLKLWLMVQSTRVNGMPKVPREMEEGYRFGQMAQDMMGCGKTTSRRATVDSSSWLVTLCMKVTVKLAESTVKEEKSTSMMKSGIKVTL